MPEVTRFVGIDVAMNSLDVHLDPAGEAFTVPNNAAGVRCLAARFGPGAVIALEASGGYERTAAEGLAQAGCTVLRRIRPTCAPSPAWPAHAPRPTASMPP